MPDLLLDKIDGFNGEYRYLSNFWYARFRLNGCFWPTVEHYYQAMKSSDHQYWSNILSGPPSYAKRLGKTVQVRADWDQLKDQVMLEGVRAKFGQNADLTIKLLLTGTAELIERNWWHDTYWGVCNGQGENRLGKILMRVRDELTTLQTHLEILKNGFTGDSWGAQIRIHKVNPNE